MKKFFLFAAFAAICLTGIVSCSSDESISEASNALQKTGEASESDNDKLCKLRLKLQDFNGQQFEETSQVSQPTSTVDGPRYKNGKFKRFWRRFWKVVVADVTGALKGATVSKTDRTLGIIEGAVSASANALESCLEKKEVSSENTTLQDEATTPAATRSTNVTDSITVRFDPIVYTRKVLPTVGTGRLLTPIDSMGYYHNMAIIEFNTSHPNWLYMSTDEITNEIGVSIAKVTGWCTPAQWSSFVNQNGYVAETNEYLRQLVVNDNLDVKDMCAELKKQYPECAGQIDVVYEAIKGLAACDAEEYETADYAEKILTMIEEAGLSKDLTTQLRSGIVVANASYKLWDAAIIE